MYINDARNILELWHAVTTTLIICHLLCGCINVMDSFHWYVLFFYINKKIKHYWVTWHKHKLESSLCTALFILVCLSAWCYLPVASAPSHASKCAHFQFLMCDSFQPETPKLQSHLFSRSWCASPSNSHVIARGKWGLFLILKRNSLPARLTLWHITVVLSGAASWCPVLQGHWFSLHLSARSSSIFFLLGGSVCDRLPFWLNPQTS